MFTYIHILKCAAILLFTNLTLSLKILCGFTLCLGPVVSSTATIVLSDAIFSYKAAFSFTTADNSALK